MGQPKNFSTKGNEHMICKLSKSIYMNLNKFPDNGILSSMISSLSSDLRKTLLISVYI